VHFHFIVTLFIGHNKLQSIAGILIVLRSSDFFLIQISIIYIFCSITLIYLNRKLKFAKIIVIEIDLSDID
jgi:hypothetical protein